jgi:hypothetical protein
MGGEVMTGELINEILTSIGLERLDEESRLAGSGIEKDVNQK